LGNCVKVAWHGIEALFGVWWPVQNGGPSAVIERLMSITFVKHAFRPIEMAMACDVTVRIAGTHEIGAFMNLTIGVGVGDAGPAAPAKTGCI
jgi:hypothetical protein